MTKLVIVPTTGPRNPSSGGVRVRRLIWSGLALLTVLGAYCGGWWYVSERSRAEIVAWIESRPADRMMISPGELRRGGFPFSVRWTFTDPTFEANWALGDVAGHVKSLAIWLEVWTPSKVRFQAEMSSSSLRHGPTDRAWRLDLAALSGVVEKTAPGAFEVQLTSAAVRMNEVSPRDTSVEVRRIADVATARVTFIGHNRPKTDDDPWKDAATFVLEEISVPGSKDLLGADTGRARARVTLSGSIGDGSIEDLVEWRDESGVIEVEKFKVDWGPMDLAFDGTLALDEQLRLLGAGSADIRGLPVLIERLAKRGDIEPSGATIAKLALALLTRPAKDGGAAVVRLPLTAQNGTLRAGPFVLGRLPPIIR
jgi:hypothetical protein